MSFLVSFVHIHFINAFDVFFLFLCASRYADVPNLYFFLINLFRYVTATESDEGEAAV